MIKHDLALWGPSRTGHNLIGTGGWHLDQTSLRSIWVCITTINHRNVQNTGALQSVPVTMTLRQFTAKWKKVDERKLSVSDCHSNNKQWQQVSETRKESSSTQHHHEQSVRVNNSSWKASQWHWKNLQSNYWWWSLTNIIKWSCEISSADQKGTMLRLFWPLFGNPVVAALHHQVGGEAIARSTGSSHSAFLQHVLPLYRHFEHPQ